ncbi:unannotated protein [freshwater metagenome]|uniref:Unannotated protein n=1 Tax=freshwater metagenome TaxID=449393 RepID=A0A6J6E8R1_9ZZZZ
MGANASDSHDLPSNVDDLESLEKKLLVLLKRRLVTIQHGLHCVIGRDVRQVFDDWRIVHDDSATINHLGQLVQRLQSGVTTSLLNKFRRPLLCLCWQHRDDLVNIDFRVPDVKLRLVGENCHP